MQVLSSGITKKVMRIEEKVTLLASLFLLGRAMQNWLRNNQEEKVELQYQLLVLTVVLQVIEVGLIWIGLKQGQNKWYKAIYVLPKCIVIFFVSGSSHRQYFLFLVMSYAIVDVFECVNLAYPAIRPYALLRHISPLVVGWFIPVYWCLLMNDYIKANAQTICYQTINGIRLAQLFCLIHAVVIYRMAFRQFRSYFQDKPLGYKEVSQQSERKAAMHIQ